METLDQKTTKSFRRSSLFFALLIVGATLMAASFINPASANAATATEIDRDVDAALELLYDKNPAAREMAKMAKGVLVFPGIVKGGLIVGGQYGVGALREGNKTYGYYNSVAASYGLQAGLQKFGYALFFITDTAIEHIKNSSGWEIGVGPSIVIVDEGMAKALTTTTAKEDIYAFFFDYKGLMGGLGLQGSKITKITPDKE